MSCSLQNKKNNIIREISKTMNVNSLVSVDAKGIIHVSPNKDISDKNVIQHINLNINKFVQERMGQTFFKSITIKKIANNKYAFVFSKELEDILLKKEDNSKFSNGKIFSKEEIEAYNEASLSAYTEIYDEGKNNIDNTKTYDVNSDIENQRISTSLKPKRDVILAQKNMLVNTLETALINIKNKKKKFSTDKDYIKKLTRKEQEIKLRLEGDINLGITGLKNEIQDILKHDDLQTFLNHTSADLDRLSILAKSDSYAALQEASTIIQFYKNIGTFSVEHENALFDKKHIFDKQGNRILNEQIVDRLTKLKERAESYENIIYQQQKNTIMSTVQSVKNLENKTYDEVFATQTGMKDATWLDLYIMDATNGILSHNGVIPGVMQVVHRRAYNENLAKAKDFKERLDSIEEDVIKELQNMGYKLPRTLISKKGAMYDIFQQHENGLKKDGLVQRYSAKYFNAQTKMFTTYKNMMEEATAKPTGKQKMEAYLEALKYKEDWYKKNTVMIDPRKIKEVREAFPEFKDHNIEDEGVHEKELKEVLGEKGYKEQVDHQIKLLKDYKVQREVFEEGLSDNFTEKTKKMEIWDKANSPFTYATKYYDNKDLSGGDMKINNTLRFNTFVPKNQDGNYDENFKKIEQSEVLTTFYGLVKEFQETVIESMPPHLRQKFNTNSLPQIKKTVVEILFDPNLPFSLRVSKALTAFYDWILTLIGKKVEDTFSYAKVNPITGIPEYRVNDSFLKSNKQEIDARFSVEFAQLNALLKLRSRMSNDMYEYEYSKIPQEVVDLLASNLGISNTIEALQARFPDNPKKLNVKKILRDAIGHQVMQEQSYDLPKIMRVISDSMALYNSRQEVLPTTLLMKEHYQRIKKNATTEAGETITNKDGKSRLEGLRINANKQMEQQFRRNILGSNESKSEFGDMILKKKAKLQLTAGEEKEVLAEELQSVSNPSRVYSSRDRIMRSKIDNVIKDLQEQMNSVDSEAQAGHLQGIIANLEEKKSKLGLTLSFTKMMDTLFQFIRFRGLGFNFSSQITNFSQGQISNFSIAATGKYFTYENIFEASRIVNHSIIKTVSGNKIVTPTGMKVSILVKRFNLLQDNSNDLQKAERKTAFANLYKLAPYQFMKSIEFLNQTPLMVAVLMDTKIKGIDGKESSVWHAMDKDGKLMENFRTEDNINNWEKTNGKEFNDFWIHTSKTISAAHGDYDELRGILASEYMSGKAILMFKKWLPRAIHNRFAIEQYDVELGRNIKGRYRSHTAITGMMQGALIGFGSTGIFGMGLPGAIIGGAVGYFMGKNYGINTQISNVKELLIMLREMAMSFINIPLGLLRGKQLTKEKYKDLKISKDDIGYYRANIQSMALSLGMIMFMLAVKAMLWDDDDDEKATKRRLHNFFINRLMQLTSEADMFLNPMEMYKQATNTAVLKFFDDVGKTITSISDTLNGEGTLLTGPHKGDSKIFRSAQKAFLPSVLNPGLGFGNASARQFFPSAYDSWFYSDNKKAQRSIKNMKAEAMQAVDDAFDSGEYSESEQENIKKKIDALYKAKNADYVKKLEELKKYDVESKINDWL